MYLDDMNEILEIVEPYIELETSIRELMIALFSESCAMCTACCCRADVCEETTASAFLSLLLDHQKLTDEQMDDRYGWLDVHGCMLGYGRPPVCYTYFCDDLLVDLPDDESRLVAQTLGRLIEYVGEKALGDWHLTEITDEEALEEVSVEDLLERLETALHAFEVIEEFTQSGRLSSSGRALLEQIGTDEE
jgi:hypothetical protein